MKPTLLIKILLVALFAGLAQAVNITVGDDGDLTPAAGGQLDGATPMVIVDYQANLYTNNSGAAQVVSPKNFVFYADIGAASNTAAGHVQPFVAKLTGAGTAAAEYDIVAVGTNRVQDIDFADGDIATLAFAEGAAPFSVEDGEVLVGGIMQGTNGAGSNVVPFAANSGLDTFITGNSAATAIGVATDITPGGSTWTSLNGGRNYEFTIELETVEEDADGDGLPDQWEDDNSLDKNDNGENPNNNGEVGNPDNGPLGDPDGDLLNNLGEYNNQADPRDDDSDDDLLLDNDEVIGAGLRPPTLPNQADSDNDGLDDLVETNTGMFASATDTGSNPRISDSDNDGVSDGDELSGENPGGFTSNPNLVDSDGDDVDDRREYQLGTDPSDPSSFPTTVFIGDAAPLATAVVDNGAADNANTGNLTYALQGSPYTNASGGAEEFEITGVNFWADGGGDLTPLVTLYNGQGVGPAANYKLLAIGDVVTAVAGSLNNAAFTVGGETATITVEDGETILAGFHQTARVVPFSQVAGSDADYLDTENQIGALGEPFLEDANWDSLTRTYALNISLEPSSTTPFRIVDIVVDTELSSATVTWNSRPGVDYAVWASDDLQSWGELTDNAKGSVGATTTSYTESPLPPDAVRRYYQIRLP